MGEDRLPTPSQTVGPFFGFALPFAAGTDAADGTAAIRIEGQLLDGSGDPVPDGLVEIWGGQQFARCRTDAEGAFHFTVTKPLADRDDEAPHLEVMVFARGLLRQIHTRCYFADDPSLDGDPVLGLVPAERRATLLAHPDPAEHGRWVFDVRLQGTEETVFFSV